MRIIPEFIAFLLLYFIYLPFKLLPYRAAMKLGQAVTATLYPLARKHRKIAADNIRHAFPEKTETEIEDLVYRNFQYLGKLLAGAMYGPRINKKWIDTYQVYDNNSEQIENNAIESPEGVVMISGHHGNWEILAHFLGFHMHGVALYKKVKNRFVEKWLHRTRAKSGLELVPVQDSKTVIKHLRNGRWVGFAADQNAGPGNLFINFMNRPAATYRGPALMAYMTESRIVYYSGIYDETDRIHFRITDLGVVRRSDYKDREEAIEKITAMWTSALEKEVRENPEQYFWVHRRWKTRPPEEKT